MSAEPIARTTKLNLACAEGHLLYLAVHSRLNLLTLFVSLEGDAGPICGAVGASSLIVCAATPNGWASALMVPKPPLTIWLKKYRLAGLSVCLTRALPFS